jgi:hypothetical protein
MVSPFPIEQFATMLGVSTTALFTFIIASSIWTVILKGFTLWFSAKNDQKAWFIALLVLNTLGILEVIYLLFFRSKR